MAERETWEMNDFFGLAPFPVAMTSLSFFFGLQILRDACTDLDSSALVGAK